jgi:hypothetical protein
VRKKLGHLSAAIAENRIDARSYIQTPEATGNETSLDDISTQTSANETEMRMSNDAFKYTFVFSAFHDTHGIETMVSGK